MSEEPTELVNPYRGPPRSRLQGLLGGGPAVRTVVTVVLCVLIVTALVGGIIGGG
jgi:hypothetical protein